jgi:hypothetical protein
MKSAISLRAPSPRSLFFWLVVGYWQQGIELRQNAKALMIQARELALQTQETKALVQETAKQAAAAAEMLNFEVKKWRAAEHAEINAQPRWEARGSSKSGEKLTLSILNEGAPARGLRIAAIRRTGDFQVQLKAPHTVRTGDLFHIEIVSTQALPNEFTLQLIYLDARRVLRVAMIDGNSSGGFRIDAFDPAEAESET